MQWQVSLEETEEEKTERGEGDVKMEAEIEVI